MKKFLILVVIIILLALAALGYWKTGNLAVNPQDSSSKIFVINKGDTVREIGNNLKEQGLIRDAVVFFLYIKINNQDKNVQAGAFKISPSMDLPKIMDTLNHGILDIWVTVPEGMRAEEISDILKENIPSYDESWRAELNQHEGYLFPDTYLIPRDADVEMIVSIMRNNFDKKVADLKLISGSQRERNVVILASLIEREAITDAEKPLIAGILTNRLNTGIALQVDATVQYAKGYDDAQKKWWPQITTDDYESVDSSYNTYLSPGLPPAPISNPGIEAIKAAASPQDTDYIFYIHSKGKIYPAKTIDEHNANVEKYL